MANKMKVQPYHMGDWHPGLGNRVHADAAIDRIVHNAVKIYGGSVNIGKYIQANGGIQVLPSKAVLFSKPLTVGTGKPDLRYGLPGTFTHICCMTIFTGGR